MRSHAQQYTLDFTSRQNELLGLISGLRHVALPVSPAKVEGIVTLLRRIILLSEKSDDRTVVVDAQKSKLGGGFNGERSVGEKTIQDWKRAAIALGVLRVDVRSQQWGHRYWNRWTIDLDELRRVLSEAGRGWKRLEETSTPRLEETSTPRVEETSTPYMFHENVSRINVNRTGPVYAGSVRLLNLVSELPDWPELHGALAEEQLPAVSDAELLGMPSDMQDWFAGKRRGTLGDCKPDEPGLFKPLLESWLSSDEAMEFWHRWQLRSDDPVVGATKAHQALVLAAARHAAEFPKSRLKRNRIGLFVGIVSKRFWAPVRSRLQFVVAAAST